MKTRSVVAGVAALGIAGAVIAQDKANLSGGIEGRLDRIEQAIARLEAKVMGHQSGGMMDGCRDMMGGGGMMGRGMTGEDGKRGSPNDQWRKSSAR